MEFRQLGEECAKTAWCLLNSSDWKLEKSGSMSGDTVHSRYVGKKKLFKLQGVVNLPAKFLLEELFYRSESLPTWNPTITEYRTIQARPDKVTPTLGSISKSIKNNRLTYSQSTVTPTLPTKYRLRQAGVPSLLVTSSASAIGRLLTAPTYQPHSPSPTLPCRHSQKE